ncbi:UNVERIFIED_CONTAM: hypothetical protein HDU68_005450 [Siphonaria sp. JEL0065]|nr:hypothetical protein HDU68_005450 [Siphonaria sp. JEL0065]
MLFNAITSLALFAGSAFAAGVTPRVIDTDFTPETGGHFGLNQAGGPAPVILHPDPTARSMTEPMNLYIVWYGTNWKKADKAIITDFLGGLGKSDFWKVTQKYWQQMPDGSRKNITGDLKIAGQVDDAYSFGKVFNTYSDPNWNDVPIIIQNHIKNGGLKSDVNGFYLVLGDDQTVEGSSCSQYCGYHTSVLSDQDNGIAYNYTVGIDYTSPDYIYTYVGNSAACGLNGAIGCGGPYNDKTPNGNAGVDAMLSPIAHELAEGASNPDTSRSAWNNADGYENGDNCAYIYGSNRKYNIFGDYYYNQEWNGRRYHIQQMWDPETQLCGATYKKASKECGKLQTIFPTLNFGDDCCNSGYVDCADGQIVSVDVRGNGLSGDLKELINKFFLNFPFIKQLFLGSNKFSTTEGFPEQICQLTFLEALSLSGLGMKGGRLPDCLFTLFNLKYLGLSNTGLTGPISSYAFRNFAPLRILSLAGNNFTGPIPKTLAAKTTLTKLFLSNNPLLSGQIPNGFVGFKGQSTGPSDNKGPVVYADFTGTQLCIAKGYKGPTGGAPQCKAKREARRGRKTATKPTVALESDEEPVKKTDWLKKKEKDVVKEPVVPKDEEEEPVKQPLPLQPSQPQPQLQSVHLPSTQISQDLNETRRFIDALLKGDTSPSNEQPTATNAFQSQPSDDSPPETRNMNGTEPQSVSPHVVALNIPIKVAQQSPVESIAEEFGSDFDDNSSISESQPVSQISKPQPQPLQSTAGKDGTVGTELNWDAGLSSSHADVSLGGGLPGVTVGNPLVSHLSPEHKDDQTDAYSFEFDASDDDDVIRADYNAFIPGDSVLEDALKVTSSAVKPAVLGNNSQVDLNEQSDYIKITNITDSLKPSLEPSLATPKTAGPSSNVTAEVALATAVVESVDAANLLNSLIDSPRQNAAINPDSSIMSSSAPLSPVQDSSFYLSSPEKSFAEDTPSPIAYPNAELSSAAIVENGFPSVLPPLPPSPNVVFDSDHSTPSSPSIPPNTTILPIPENTPSIDSQQQISSTPIVPSTTDLKSTESPPENVDFKGNAYETFVDFLSKTNSVQDLELTKPGSAKSNDVKKLAKLSNSSPARNTASSPNHGGPVSPARKPSAVSGPPPPVEIQRGRKSSVTSSTVSFSSQIPRRTSATTSTTSNKQSTVKTFPTSSASATASAKKAALKRTNEKLMAVKAAAADATGFSSLTKRTSQSSSPTRKPASVSSKKKTMVPPTARTPSPRVSLTTTSSIPLDTPDLMAQLNRILKPDANPSVSIAESTKPATSLPIDAEDPLVKLSMEAYANDLYTIKKELAAKELENTKLKEEILFLERWRDQESQNRPSVNGATGDAKYAKEELASKEDIERVKKDIQEQETLIQGYQHENEKLIDQLKTTKKQHKDQESKSFLRIETLQREIQTLKTTLNNPSQQQPASFDSLKLAAKVDELNEKICSQERDFGEKESGYVGEISKLKAQLSEAKTHIDGFKGCTIEDVEAMKKSWEEEKNRLEGFIVELEARIEKEVMYKEMMMEKENEEMEARLADAGVDVHAEKKAVAGKALRTNSSSNLMKGKSASGGPEGRRIKELEKLVVELQDKLAKNAKSLKDSLPELLLANRPTMEEATYIRHLKDHIKKLQSEIETKEASWFSKLQILHSETTDLKERYETKLAELHIRMEETQAASAQAIASAASVQNLASTNHINELEHQFESLLAKYHDKLIEATDLEVSDHLQHAESKIALAYKSREAKLRSRVVELENLLDSQAATMESMRSDRAAAEKDAQLRTQMKDALVQSYETKIASLRKEFHDRVFGGEEQKLLSEIHRLRTELETLRGDNSDLKNRLEISEATRQSVHENTIAILKQAQEESAKIALAHHERALTMLRDETKSQTAAMLDSEVRRLQRALAETETEVTRWQNKTATLEKEKQSWRDGQRNATLLAEAQEKLELLEQTVKELQILNSDLQTQLQNSRSQWPPDRKRFNELETMLADMETGFRKREMELQELITLTKRDADGQVAKLKAKYIPALEKRDSELIYFRDEVFRLVEAIEEMERSRK